MKGMLVGYPHLKGSSTHQMFIFYYLFDLKRIITPTNKHLIWYLLHRLKFAFEKISLPFSYNFPKFVVLVNFVTALKIFQLQALRNTKHKSRWLETFRVWLTLASLKIYRVHISPVSFVSFFFSKRYVVGYKIKVQYNFISLTIHLIQNLCSEIEMNDFH